MGVGRTSHFIPSHPSSCSVEAAMWTSPCLEPGCGSCWAQLGCRKYMEISCRLSKVNQVDLKHFRHFERSWNRPCQISQCTRPHNSPLHFDQLFLRSDRLKLLALRAVGASGGASSNEQIPKKCRWFPETAGPLLLSWRLKLWVSQKGASFLDANYYTVPWPSDPLQRKRTSVDLTLWLHDFTGRNDHPNDQLLFDGGVSITYKMQLHPNSRCLPRSQIKNSKPDHKQCERYPLYYNSPPMQHMAPICQGKS